VSSGVPLRVLQSAKACINSTPPAHYAAAVRNGELGFWWRSVGGPGARRAPLEGGLEADVAIVGAGYTGLWTAYYLKAAEPSLRVVLLEREHAGFGASGRNGGWVSGFFSGPARAYESGSAGGRFRALRREMFATVDEVHRFLLEHEIDADFLKSGKLTAALNDAQASHVRAWVQAERELGLDERDLHELDADALALRIRIARACCGALTPHVARVHPVKLLRGLAEIVERSGATIYESTAVSEIRPHEARTAAGSVRARWVVRASEGYTVQLHGLRRALVPLNSSMIITEPLPPEAWEEIGWSGAELLGDAAHVYFYAQRTADGRIAIGGRGVPYRFSSASGGSGETAAATVELLKRKLASLFPATAAVPIDHAWSGVLGVARDWCVSVQADRDSGLASVGGYVGLGVAAANLAGRTLRDLILGHDTELTALPWVGHRSPRWEPEPIRWAAINGLYALYRQADRIERRSGKPSRLAHLLDRASGRV
jgi:glycine/D-amino acid oxidase-like deaminating enzyme